MMPTHQAPPPQRPGPYQERGHGAPAGRPRASTILAGKTPAPLISKRQPLPDSSQSLFN
ncbi:hypothetical protein ABFV05_010267 [Capra hircus]